MKTKLFTFLLFLLPCLALSAQPDKKKGMRQLRNYYVSQIGSPSNITDLQSKLDRLNEDGQFIDLIPYEQEIKERKLLERIGFDEQQKMGLYLAEAMNRLRDISGLYHKKEVSSVPHKFWKAVMRYGTIEVNRRPNDRFHASCFAIPQAVCHIYFTLNPIMEEIEQGNINAPLLTEANKMLKTLAMQSWTQPLRNDETDKNVVQIDRFRHHVWWVGGNALAYRPLLQTAVIMDSIPMVDLMAEVARKSLSNVSQTTYKEAFWNEGFTADGAGWGHGLQCLVWGYPIHGASSALNMLAILRGTPWAQTLDRENADALLNFYRGSNFYHFKGFIPPCLDRYSMTYYEGKHAPVPYYEMLKRTINEWAGSFTEAEVKEMKQLAEEAGRENINMDGYPDGLYSGSRWFYNNDDLIKKNNDYYVMVNMASVRCDGLESANNFADEFNIYTNDGLTLFQRQGDEYRKIIGAMDLTAMPGITAREGARKLKPITNWRGFCSRHNFAAGATSGGENAVAGYIFEKMDATEKEKPVTATNPVAFGVKAHKSYFILGDYMVALGTRITNLDPAQPGTIRTSIDQTVHQNTVSVYDGKKVTPARKGVNSFFSKNKPLWVMQKDGFAYTVLPQYTTNAYYTTETKPNQWVERNLTNKGKANLPQSANILRLWADHGREVENGTYGYVVYCGKGLPANEMPFNVLSNNTDIQAIQSADKKITEAVFYNPGVRLTSEGINLQVSAPCALLIEDTGNQYCISVTDAEMNTSLKQIEVIFNNKTISIPLPQGKECGKCVTVNSPYAQGELLKQIITDPHEYKKRMEWFEDARFGMFIHWGVYSTLGCSWNGKKYGGYGEHIQRMAQIPICEYREKVAGTFNPESFDADEWIRIAKETGMQYFIITSKHHDGFAMYDSKVSDYNIVKATPFGRDPIKELRDACRKAGIKFGVYYSHAFDWGERDGVGNDWDYNNPGGDKLLWGRNWWENNPLYLPIAKRYVDEKAIPQILELIKNYNPDIMWFDTPHKLPQEENIRIVKATREASPNIIINGRAIQGFDSYDYYNTNDTPVEFINYKNRYWEGIPTTNHSYAYNENDNDYKEASFFIRLMAKATARGGNILMNIGPMGNGMFSNPDKQILKGIADWWKVNGETSIRGAGKTPLPVHAWGESTLKGNNLYLHIFNWPADGKLFVSGLQTPVKKAYLLNDRKNLKISKQGSELVIQLPAICPDTINTVLALECKSVPVADNSRRLLVGNISEDRIRTFDARLSSNLRFGGEEAEAAYVQNFSQLTDVITWPVRLNEETTYDVFIDYAASAPQYTDELVEGDAGKEIRKASSGAAGTYLINIGGQTLERKVANGTFVTEKAGRVTLSPGTFDITIRAKEILATELFRPRAIILKPVK